MTNEELIRREAKAKLAVADRIGIRISVEPFIKHIMEGVMRLYKSEDKAIFLDEAIQYVQRSLESHRNTCPKGPGCPTDEKYQQILFYLQQDLDLLSLPMAAPSDTVPLVLPLATIVPALTHLHPTIQQAAGSLFASTHYPQAILAACTALDKAVQVKARLPASTVGTALMTTAFSAKSPLIQLSQDTNEQMGFMNLYQGSVQAIRNHYAHNLTGVPAPRALEWLGFISALFHKLDEA